ncbi:hypothetical protein RAS1_30170 [Phycisphaerae bacterium RAS1]|nr:hypothetical protein RAS1_30170 [Phycisphaerae bacterium RAS1]
MMASPELDTCGMGLQPVPSRPSVAVTFGMLGDLRYISHHDELRMLARALVRARWPVAFSQGFNPRPRIVLPLPRPVGVSSSCELAIVELEPPAPHDPNATGERAPGEAMRLESGSASLPALAGASRSGATRDDGGGAGLGGPTLQALVGQLRAALPQGCPLVCVHPHASRKSPQPLRMWYTLELDETDVARVCARVAPLLAQSSVVVLRDAGPGRTPQPGDIRPNVETLSLSGSQLEIGLRFADQRTARPTELLEALDLPAETYAHRMHRRRVEWNMDVTGDQKSPQLQVRDTLGYEESQSQENQQGLEGQAAASR